MSDVVSTDKRIAHKVLMAVTFLLAAPLAVILLVHPSLMLDEHGHYSHNAMMLIMLGISGGFIYGVGFIPRFWLWKWVFHPLLSIPLMLWGYYTWLFI